MAKKLKISNSLDSSENVKSFSDDIHQLCKIINKKISNEGGRAEILSDKNEIKTFVSSGSILLDTIIRNARDGGFPVGRIIECFGPPGSGKSLLASHVLANTQKLGGLAVFIDTEAALSKEFLVTIGVDITKMIRINIPTVEDTFSTIDSIIQYTKENPQIPFTSIVWDSLAGSSDKVETEGEYEASGYGMAKAKLLSKGFRKITNLIADNNVLLFCTNQIRDNLATGYGANQYATGGGWALKFYASLRLYVNKFSDIAEEVDVLGKKEKIKTGVKVRVRIEKSRIAPPFRDVELNVYFHKGIDDESSWFDALVKKGIIEKPTTQSYLLKFSDGREFKFRKNDWEKVMQENNLKDEIRNLLIDSHIIDYGNLHGEDIEDVPDVIEEQFEKELIEIKKNIGDKSVFEDIEVKDEKNIVVDESKKLLNVIMNNTDSVEQIK